jgi:cleavage and polyadenylation specificity factor subunit 1
VLLGDVHKSVSFVRYVEKEREGQVMNPEREKYRQLLFMSKDHDQRDITASEFVTDGKKLGLLSCDGGQSLHLFQYDKDDPESWQGKRLMPQASFFLGVDVRCMRRLKLGGATNRRAALIATVHGSVGSFLPLGDAGFAVLSKLCQLMQRKVEHPCGLNPRAFRYASPTQPTHSCLPLSHMLTPPAPPKLDAVSCRCLAI